MDFVTAVGDYRTLALAGYNDFGSFPVFASEHLLLIALARYADTTDERMEPCTETLR